MGFTFTEMQKKANGGTEQVCRMLEANLPTDLLEHFQIIPSRVDTLQEDKIRIMFLHDLPQDPETNHLANKSSRERFHRIVFCGHWQYNQYLTHLNLQPSLDMSVIDTPIVPIDWVPKSKNEIRLAYTSTPQRGLQILVPVFEKLCEKYDNIYLDVFSSFEIYGWSEADKQYQDLFDRCKTHPKIVYHGYKPNEYVRSALQQAHIFAYPSIWQECNSRALIESMSAGMLCVHPNLAGLSDTSGSLTTMYQFDADPNRHAALFYQVMDHTISIVHSDQAENYVQYVKQYADNRFNISKIAGQWNNILASMLNEYPEDSRGLPKPSLSFNTNPGSR